jgi:hypothetical protein
LAVVRHHADLPAAAGQIGCIAHGEAPSDCGLSGSAGPISCGANVEGAGRIRLSLHPLIYRKV